VAALFVSAPFLDPVAGRFAFVAVSSDFGFHARALTTAAAVAAPVLVPLGVVLPTLVAREHGRPGSDRTGILLAFHGLGNLAGAIAVGWLLPRFGVPVSATLTKALLAAVCVTIAWRATWGRLASGRLVPATLVVAPFALSLVFPAAGPFVGTRNDRANLDILADATDAHGTATVAYDRQNHAMVLFTDEFRAAETGPGTGYMRVLGHLPKLILQDAVAGGGSGARIAVIALGTGTTANALAAWPDHEVLHVVEISRAVLELAPWFSGDGPLAIRRDDPRPAWQRDPRTRVHCTDGRRWLAAAGDEEEALDLVTMEPLLPYDPGTAALYSREFYRLVHDRLRPGGLCVQWIPTHAMPADTFRTLLRTFAAEFDPVSVWLVDQATLLVGIRGGWGHGSGHDDRRSARRAARRGPEGGAADDARSGALQCGGLPGRTCRGATRPPRRTRCARRRCCPTTGHSSSGSAIGAAPSGSVGSSRTTSRFSTRSSGTRRETMRPCAARDSRAGGSSRSRR
jgi:hypothetical protein